MYPAVVGAAIGGMLFAAILTVLLLVYIIRNRNNNPRESHLHQHCPADLYSKYTETLCFSPQGYTTCCLAREYLRLLAFETKNRTLPHTQSIFPFCFCRQHSQSRENINFPEDEMVGGSEGDMRDRGGSSSPGKTNSPSYKA